MNSSALKGPNRLSKVEIGSSIGKAPSPEAESDRQLAIYDLLEANTFKLSNDITGPYTLHLSTLDQRLIFEFLNETNQTYTIGLSLSPFRRVMKDYFEICDSYNMAVKASNPRAIEAIDMARRGIHNDGSALLQERLTGKAEMDFDTARRLFTLVCSLMWRAS
jgi:uncharacterized protein (UPF0262 family)